EGNATVRVSKGSTVIGSATLTLQNTAPGLFILGTQAAVVNDSGTVNSPSQPATVGGWVAAYLTGLGPVDNAVATCAPASAAPLSQTTNRVTATIGGRPAQVLFAGLAPGYAGVYQVNLIVPQLSAGDYQLQISVGGSASNTGTISVRDRP